MIKTDRIRPRGALSSLAALLITFILSQEASAQVLRYSFDGVVTSVQSFAPGGWSGVAAGDSIRAEFQVVAGAAPTTISVEDAEYLGVVNGFDVEVGGVRSSSFAGGDVTVKNDDIFNSSCTDRYSWVVSGDVGPPPTFLTVEITLESQGSAANCPGLAASLELPLALGEIPDPALNATNFTLFASSFNVVIEGRVSLSLILEDFVSSCFGDGGVSSGCTACPCGNDAPASSGGGCTNSESGSARLIVEGLPSLSQDTMRVSMSGGTISSFAILSSGAAVAPTNAANPCFGLASGVTGNSLDGLRCAVMGVVRHGNRATNQLGNVDGSTGPYRAWGESLLSQTGFAPGATRYFQAVYRDGIDVGCGTGLNTTQAIQVVLVP